MVSVIMVVLLVALANLPGLPSFLLDEGSRLIVTSAINLLELPALVLPVMPYLVPGATGSLDKSKLLLSVSRMLVMSILETIMAGTQIVSFSFPNFLSGGFLAIALCCFMFAI